MAASGVDQARPAEPRRSDARGPNQLQARAKAHRLDHLLSLCSTDLEHDGNRARTRSTVRLTKARKTNPHSLQRIQVEGISMQRCRDPTLPSTASMRTVQ